jgi:hypothetical protein
VSIDISHTVNEWWSWTAPGGPEISLAQEWLTISTIGGSRFGMPGYRGSDYEVPFRAGLQHRQKFPNSRTVSLVMSVSGTDPVTGLPASTDQVLAWNNNFQYVRQAFWVNDPLGSAQGMLTRRWYLTQAGTSQVVAGTAMAELGGSMDPTMTGRTRADFTVDLVLSDPFFYGAQQSVTLAPGSPTTLTALGEGIVGMGYASPVSSFTVALDGPLSFPTLTNGSAASAAGSSVGFTYNAAVAFGETVTVDLLAATAMSSTGANVSSKISHAGSRMWFCLVPSTTPGQPGFNAVTLSTLNPTDTGTATAQWADCYV